MIITKTPYRISFFGGGTDYHAWYEEFGGQVLSTTINHYCWISIRELSPFFDYNYRVAWRHLDIAKNINDIKHPVVKALLKEFNIKQHLNIHYDGDLPAQSGIGSSSAFACGFIKAIYQLQNLNISTKELAKAAINLEKNILKENVGIQDQIATAFGGLNHIKIKKSGDFTVNKIKAAPASIESLQDHLLLFSTGIFRDASDIAGDQIKKVKKNKNELFRISEMVDEGIEILKAKDFNADSFGKLLHDSWILKKGLSSKISMDVIDDAYNAAISSGAIGGKLLGAGGGGFLLIYAKPQNHKKIISTLHKLTLVPFRFSDKGAELVFNSN